MIGSSDELTLRAIVAFQSVAHSQTAFQDALYCEAGLRKTRWCHDPTNLYLSQINILIDGGFAFVLFFLFI